MNPMAQQLGRIRLLFVILQVISIVYTRLSRLLHIRRGFIIDHEVLQILKILEKFLIFKEFMRMMLADFQAA